MSTLRSRLIALAFGVGVGLATACSVDVDVSNKDCPCGEGYVCDTPRGKCVLPGALGPAAIPACDPCPCATDRDCSDPARPSCSPTTKTCVECSPGAADKCPPASYCNDSSQCTLGCRESSECAAFNKDNPFCAVARHECVQCLTAADCNGKACSPSGRCVESCDAGKACTGGRKCCNGLCLDVASDILNCGDCNAACGALNGTPSCAGGRCNWTCANGFAHCGSGNTGCETNIRTNPSHCGACGRSCGSQLANANGVTCANATCSFAACDIDFGDCDGDRSNGCECACGRARNDKCCPQDTCWNGLTCNPVNQQCKQ